LSQAKARAEQMCTDPGIAAIAFDIFDTLLIRPMLDPEMVKEIVAARAGSRLGTMYRAHRAGAESAARLADGRDVGIDRIYEALRQQTGLSVDEAGSLRALEEEVERESLLPRPDGIALLQGARAHGKRVILISDMFLPKANVESCLKAHGIEGWNALYLSN